MINLDYDTAKAERRELNRAEHAEQCKRGVEFTSKSGRKFRGGGPAFVGDKPIQLELAACSGKTARPRAVTLEARGAAALAELDAPGPKRPGVRVAGVREHGRGDAGHRAARPHRR